MPYVPQPIAVVRFLGEHAPRRQRGAPYLARPVTRFRYGLDPVCLAACALYATNRWMIPAAAKGTFLRGHFDDLLLVPAALPLMLWLQRALGLRRNDAPPRWNEISFHLMVWGVIAEFVTPHLTAHATGDWRDLLAYAVGAVVAGLWWTRERVLRPRVAHEFR